VPKPHNLSSRRSPRPSTSPALPRPEDQPTLTVERTAALLGIGKSSAYAAIARGEIPSLRFGNRVIVPTAGLYRMLGLDLAPSPEMADVKQELAS